MSMVLITLLSTGALASNKHCVVALNQVFDDFIASADTAYLHLHLLEGADPGALLYVVPRQEAEKDQPTGSFYYRETISSDCTGMTMTFKAENGDTAILVGSLSDIPKDDRKTASQGAPFKAVIEWFEKVSLKTTKDEVIFRPNNTLIYEASRYGIVSNIGRIIEKTTFAVCKRLTGDETSGFFLQCLKALSGKMYEEHHKE